MLCAQATGYLRLESVQRYVLLFAGDYAACGTMHNGAHLQVAKQCTEQQAISTKHLTVNSGRNGCLAI